MLQVLNLLYLFWKLEYFKNKSIINFDVIIMSMIFFSIDSFIKQKVHLNHLLRNLQIVRKNVFDILQWLCYLL
jgi:hypothetical protein